MAGRAQWGTGVATAAVWALAAGSLVAWALSGAPDDGAATSPHAATAPAADTARVAQILGATPTASAAAPKTGNLAQVKLLGVLTHGPSGAVLVAVAGARPQTVRVGAVVTGLQADWHLKSVTPHAAVFALDGREETLEMPALDARSRAGDVVVATTASPQAGAEARAVRTFLARQQPPAEPAAETAPAAPAPTQAQ